MIEDYLKKQSIQPKNYVLVHMMDEWESRAAHIGTWNISTAGRHPNVTTRDPFWQQRAAQYAPWGRVFRQFDNGVGTYFPLGWTDKFATVRRGNHTSERAHTLTFLGSVKMHYKSGGPDRNATLATYDALMKKVGLELNRKKDEMPEVKSPPRPHMDNVTSYTVGLLDAAKDYLPAVPIRLPDAVDGLVKHIKQDDGYVHTLSNSKFCLDIAGASTECFNLYEMLEAGCIPVVAKNSWLPASLHAPEVGPPPFLALDPPEAVALIKVLSADAAALDDLQRRTLDWWEAVKHHYARAFEEAVCPGGKGGPESQRGGLPGRQGWSGEP